MTRLLLAAGLALTVLPGTPASAALCEGVVDRIPVLCGPRLDVDRCDYVDCTPPYVGCVDPYFCL